MKITDLQAIRVKGNYPWVFIRIRTDAGIEGIGEAYWGHGVREIVVGLKSLLIGEDPRQVRPLVRRLLHKMSGAGSYAGTTVTAISGIEIALWDLLGKATDQPVWRLLGGKFRSSIPLYVDCHAGISLEAQRGKTAEFVDDESVEVPEDAYDPAAYARRAQQVMALGFRALKFDLDVPTGDQVDWVDTPVLPSAIELTFQRLKAVRDVVGPDVALGLDCHWKLRRVDAARLARRLEPLGLAWLEDPLAPEDLEGHAWLRTQTSIPICTGENLYRFHGFRSLIETGSADVLAPDIPKMGGIAEALRVADYAADRGLCLAPHNVSSPIGTVAAAHLCAAIPNMLFLELHSLDLPWWSKVVHSGENLIVNGQLQLPTKPGLGIEVNWDVVNQHLA